MVALKKQEARKPVKAKPREDISVEQALDLVNERYKKTLAYLGR
jgi:hypothetical protein